MQSPNYQILFEGNLSILIEIIKREKLSVTPVHHLQALSERGDEDSTTIFRWWKMGQLGSS